MSDKEIALKLTEIAVKREISFVEQNIITKNNNNEYIEINHQEDIEHIFNAFYELITQDKE